MYDVVVYLSSLQKQNPGRKVDTLTAFYQGAAHVGAWALLERDYIYRPAKLAVILGWPSPILSTQNIKFRAELVELQKQAGNHIMAIDANCFKFSDTDSKYLRYSINGVYYDTSQYANKNSDASKWNQLSQDLGLTIQSWRDQGDYLLFLIQRDGGWGMKGLDPVEWARRKIIEVRQYSNLPIVLRPHPGKVADLTPLLQPGVTISDSTVIPLLTDLQRAKAAFVFNSSSGVASVVSGVPLYVDDTSSVCWDVANKHVNQLNNPLFPDRNQWLYDLAACHWTDEESRQGLIYKKFLPYLT
ncbi:MAG: hypothetical protein RLZZ196_126 [Bacteroidota bacterium]|jgi:hypothetical protein